MNRSDFRFLEPLRVRWAEVDMQKIVFNGHYLMYFDTAVAGYWRALAMPYHDTMEALQGDLFVRKATVEYAASARYDDRLDIGVRCGRIGNSSLAFSLGVFRGGQLLVQGELLYVYADPVTQTSRPVPEALRTLFLGFEAGEPSTTLRLGDGSALAAGSRALRRATFVDEMRLPEALVEDAFDAGALQAALVNRMGQTVATARAVSGAAGTVQIGRVAIHAALRGCGLGGVLLGGLLAALRERGAREAVVQAQTAAAGLYHRLGFVATGPEYEDAGWRHVEMRLKL
jgi:YbgC/YbaW family acyl-CoA thioester hydrolase